MFSRSPLALTDAAPSEARSKPTVARPMQIVPKRSPVLQVEGIGCAYGATTVLRGVSFDVHPGEILCLVGPSGCGKTTTLRVIAGLEPATIGTVSVGGRTVSGPGTDVATEKRDVGLLFQDFALFPHMRVIDNVGFGIRGVSRSERRSRASSALAEVGLADHVRSYPHMLSGGQQQRVALARALVARPKVLLLDEPFSSLDSQLRRQVRDDTMHLLKGSDAAVVLVTHDPEEAMFMADRVAVLRDGRIEQIACPTEIYCQPSNTFVAGFFGEVNRFDAVVTNRAVITPLGRIAVSGLADGTPVEVVIRPEAIRLCEPGSGPAVRVKAARMLGRTSLVHLSVAGDSGDAHIHARVPGRFLPGDGQMLGVALDRDQTFIYPR